MSNKRCGHCEEYLPPASFHRASNTKDGLHTICKKCRCSYNSPIAHAWNLANPQRYKINQIRYRTHRRRDKDGSGAL